jgi:hypothetical protein
MHSAASNLTLPKAYTTPQILFWVTRLGSCCCVGYRLRGEYVNSIAPIFSADVTPQKLNSSAETQWVKTETIRGGLGVSVEF